MQIELPLAVIPARYGSTRFPGKPLALLAGKPMLQHVWRKCMESEAFSRVIVATDDDRISNAARAWGSEVRLTSPHCQSGTDRVAEVAIGLPGVAYFVNVQGDEPLITLEALRAIVRLAGAGHPMATLVRPLHPAERSNPNIVKAVISISGKALYFSRSDIPYSREMDVAVPRLAHIGLYAYRRDILLQLAKLPPSPLELSERLEQLRALENEIPIACAATSYEGFGIDSPADLRRAESLI